MIQKINKNNVEGKFSVKTRSALRSYLLNMKVDVLLKGILIPDDLISELESFAERNRISQREFGTFDAAPYCPRCLKAHAIRTAKTMGMDKEYLTVLNDFFDCEAGHNGYYMDGEEILEFG